MARCPIRTDRHMSPGLVLHWWVSTRACASCSWARCVSSSYTWYTKASGSVHGQGPIVHL
eukprot:6364060-Prymnesium_polylepis.1